jgi:hypothetical protein
LTGLVFDFMMDPMAKRSEFSNKQTLTGSVLELTQHLEEIKPGFITTLSPIAELPTEDKPARRNKKPSFQADRQASFAMAAQHRMNGALVRCEERYPNDGPHSVLYVVVERDAAESRKALAILYADYFGPGQNDPLAPVRLEVIDRSGDEALQRLISLGLLTRTTRATRLLWPEAACDISSQPLSEIEREKVEALRQQATRKLKMARLLGEGELLEEARSALLEALLPLGRALAIESRLPEPVQLNEVFLPPLALRWREALTPLRLFTSETTMPWRPVLESLSMV